MAYSQDRPKRRKSRHYEDEVLIRQATTTNTNQMLTEMRGRDRETCTLGDADNSMVKRNSLPLPPLRQKSTPHKQQHHLKLKKLLLTSDSEDNDDLNKNRHIVRIDKLIGHNVDKVHKLLKRIKIKKHKEMQQEEQINETIQENLDFNSFSQNNSSGVASHTQNGVMINQHKMNKITIGDTGGTNPVNVNTPTPINLINLNPISNINNSNNCNNPLNINVNQFQAHHQVILNMGPQPDLELKTEEKNSEPTEKANKGGKKGSKSKKGKSKENDVNSESIELNASSIHRFLLKTYHDKKRRSISKGDTHLLNAFHHAQETDKSGGAKTAKTAKGKGKDNSIPSKKANLL
jgi:hypothetical protein